MTISIDPALVARLSGEFGSLAGEFTALGGQMNTLGHDLASLHRQVLSAAPAKTAAPPGAPPDAVPSAGVRVGGVHTPEQPDSASSPGEAGSGTHPGTPPPTHESTASPKHLADQASTLPGWGAPAPKTAPHPAPPKPPHSGPVRGALPQRGQAQPGGTASSRGHSATTASMYRQALGQVPPTGAAQPPRGPLPPRQGGPGSRPPSPPWWQREGIISRLLAVAGVAVTLIGVVMLLVLAAQAGIFGPVPRVVAGAVLSAALVGAGMRVFRRPGGRVGGIALAATGFAGAYLDVIAMTTIYDWLHPVPGFAAALGVAAAGVGLAVQWRSQPLAVLVVAGAAVLAPFVTIELALLAFLIVLQVACVPVQRRYDWPFLHLVRTVPAVLATHFTILAFAIEQPDDRQTLVVAAATAVAAVGLGGAILVTRQRPGDLVASLTCALACTPLLAAPALVDRPAATLLSAGYAAVLLAVAATPLVPKLRDVARIPGHTAIVAGTAGSFALLEALWGVTTGSTLPLGLLLVGACYLGVAGQAQNRVAALFGTGYAVLGGIGLLTVADLDTLAISRRALENLSTATAAAALAGLGVLAVALWTLRRLFGTTTDESVTTLLWIGASGAALYLATTAAVSLGVAAGAANGFVIGHSVSTIIWMAGALAALLYGLRRLGADVSATVKVALGSGLLVTAAALAKLFLFDLSTLDGLIRVAAFLMVGILLLVAGTRYARAFAEAGSRESRTE
ncbi:DUF2339 domain-containing protein [Nocardia carnea]|uniref:DUF2339 domain-containing protein n=1 Tax=Nocardia carnea TaxID=37328 RepID=A0ABW7TKX9_9NOCA|nr:DUF2339 domain-containing protein [Nocardia carnea]